VLTEAQIDHLFNEVKAFPGYRLVVDLENQRITTSNGSVSYPFEIDAFRKYCLMNGLDDIGLTLRHADRSAPSKSVIWRTSPGWPTSFKLREKT
jgi:3-isopropylmalate/(R)-2-methylmalate dehydratase small subunit